MPPHLHDRDLLDALEGAATEAFSGEAWRTTWWGREPLRGSSADGRWSPAGAFEVLYTSLEREGSLAEIGYRLSLEPIWPSKARHVTHRLRVATKNTLRLVSFAELAPLGVVPALYPTLDYARTQAIAAAARFLGFDGLLVPSARDPSTNLVLFLDQIDLGDIDVLASEEVDWVAWRRAR